MTSTPDDLTPAPTARPTAAPPQTAARPSLEAFLASAEAWLGAHADRRRPDAALTWGEGSDSVALFRNLSFQEERAHIDALRAWQRTKSDAGYGSISWPVEHGGSGLPGSYERAFQRLEGAFDTPPGHEAVGITMDLVAPTYRTVGTDEQKDRYLRPMRRTDEMWCQLFSEPGAGSDLASLTTRAERDGDGWVVNGQKVWTSGAQYADFGYLLARTDPTAPKHRGLTAFLFPMDAPGVEVRPLRQMSGGSSFNEVFLSDVAIPDSGRLGARGAGWQVALTTLGFERAAATASSSSGGAVFDRLVLLARHRGLDADPVVRQRLARVYIQGKVRSLTNRRTAAALRAGAVPGPEGSIGKLAWTEGLREISDVAGLLCGPGLAADTGEWGTFAWSEFVNGVPGFRVAGGSDEIQRSIIAERVLGLPRERAVIEVLVVDDDPPIVEAVRRGLEREGFAVTTAADGRAALDRVAEGTTQIVVLDAGLPDLDGVEVTARLRAGGVDVPILILSARTDVVDRVAGLEAGADDYLVKPFAMSELVARLHALLRRVPRVAVPVTVGDLRVDPLRHVVHRGDRMLELTRREFDLLLAFAEHPGIVLDRTQLLVRVWGYDFEVDTNVVDVFVGYLRRKLEAEGEPRILQTVRGVGFVLRP